MTLEDRFGRNLHYLRISVTDRCNLRCIYCMPPEGVPYFKHERILRYEEMLQIARVAHSLGMRRLRVTGGEPLVRKDVVEFLRSLHVALPKLEDLALTTNGVLLEPLARSLKQAGVDRVNVSLDTLDRDRFRELTRVGNVDQVVAGVEAAVRAGLNPVKLNAVLMHGVNDDLESVLELLRFAREYRATLRFIELMPVGVGIEDSALDGRYVPAATVIELLRAQGMPLERDQAPERGGGPAVYYRLASGGRVGFISALSDGFCAQCSRLRLTADGKLYPCLASPLHVDLRETMRNGASDADIEGLFRAAVELKPEEHDFEQWLRQSVTGAVKKRMSRMGG